MSRTLVLLTNPTSGKGKGAKAAQAAAERFRASGYDVTPVAGDGPEEALDLAEQAVADGVDTLVVCGGDGMVHLATQALAGSETRLGLIPAGTGNDVARYFGLPRKDPVAAADIVLTGRERVIDLGRAGSTYFVTVIAAGFDAIVNERANRMTWPKGQMRYNLATVAELGVLAPISYTLDLDGAEFREDATLVAIGNGPSFGGGLRICEGADLSDGLLDVVVVSPVSRFELLLLYPRLFNGSHIHARQFSRHRVRSLTIDAPGIIAYADGERLGPMPITIASVPRALKVLVAHD